MMPTKGFGGYKQRLAQAKRQQQQQQQDQVPEQPEHSHLARVLLEKWAWGNLSTPEVQALAHAAVHDGLSHPQIRALAGLGAHGKYPANMHRDLLRAVGAGSALVSSAMDFTLSLQASRSTWVPTLVDIILPHRLFSKMFHQRPGAFKASVLGGEESNIRSFWSAMQDHPILLARPELRSRADLLKVIPIGLHGDGVSYMQRRSGSKSLEVLSWSSLLSRGPTKANSFLIFLVVKSVLKDVGFGKSWPIVYKILSWSLTALAQGKWPEVDWNGAQFTDNNSPEYINKGQPLANGFSAVLFVLKADLIFWQITLD